MTRSPTTRIANGRPGAAWLLAAGAALLLAVTLTGCAAFTNPVADGIPVKRLPPEFFPIPKEDLKTIPLASLRQKPPDSYLLAAGDVLGVYIEGVLGDKTQPPPVRFGSEQGNVPPALGYPIPVREDGTVPLPLIQPVQVTNLTIPEAQEKIRKAYVVEKQILKENRERIIVTLMRPRQYHILVVRQDSGFQAIGAGGQIGGVKRGTRAAVDLPAYENDVMNALVRTGGLPGLDALNEVIIERGAYKPSQLKTLETNPPACPSSDASTSGVQVIRIPLRHRPGEELPFQPADVILQTGDIVFNEARDTEVYYTGGLMQPRQFILPRDYDLRVVDVVALGGGPLVNGTTNINNLTGTIQQPGIGSPSPSLVTVLRRTKNYGQLAIHVDLNRALRDPRENILIQAGDVIILQETVGEALTRYLTTVIRLNILYTFVNNAHANVNSTATLP